MATKDRFKASAAARFKREPAQLPEDFDGREEVFVRKLSAAERDAYEGGRFKIKGDGRGNVTSEPNFGNLRARLLVLALCDAEGKRLYADDEAAQLGADLPGDLADVLFEQATKFNGLARAEDAAKNGRPEGAPSPSSSPSASANGT